MIRLDKLTFLISTFGAPELYASLLNDEFVHEDTFAINPSADRILKRIGIISMQENKQSELLTRYVPVNKHVFLKKTLIRFSKEYCFEDNPLCDQCYLSKGCDYYNKKNDWIE